MYKNFTSYYLILKLQNTIFWDHYIESFENNANAKSLRVKNIQCSYLGIGSHTLDPPTCHTATRYSQVMDFAVWSLMQLDDISGLQKLGSSLNTLSIHMKQLKCTSAFHQQSLQSSLITYRCESGNALCTPLPLLELWLLSLGHFCNSEF